MNDVTILAEENGRLNAEVKSWKAAYDELRMRLATHEQTIARYKFASAVPFAVAAFMVGSICAILLTCMYKGITATGDVTHCRIVHWQNADPPQWQVEGNVVWGHDPILATAKSIDEAVEMARKLNCPLKHGAH